MTPEDAEQARRAQEDAEQAMRLAQATADQTLAGGSGAPSEK